MTTIETGRLLGDGDSDALRKAVEQMATQPVDQDMLSSENASSEWRQTTVAHPVSVSGPGTFLGKAHRTLEFSPFHEKGWWFDRTDLPGSLPIRVSVRNVWTTTRNIVLSSGSPHNYMRMVEHIIALKYLGLDNVMIRMNSGDPPLFERSSMDLVDAVQQAGIVSLQELADYYTVKEPVTMLGSDGSFLTFLPAEGDFRGLTVDCAIDFPNAIGRQRIRFPVNKETFHIGAACRTNTNLWKMLFCKTIGKLFADTRNLGYTLRNILVAGPRRYVNTPLMIHDGKSLEAVWHRAVLDLLAAVALIDHGRFAGHIISYKAGHSLDVRLVSELYQQDLLEEL